MSNVIYKVVFSGEIDPAASVEEVKEKLAARFNISNAQTEQLFAGDRNSVKESDDLQVCEKVQAAFREAGAVCTIERVAMEEDGPDPPPSQAVGENEIPDGQAHPHTREPASGSPVDDDQLPCSGCGNMFAPDDLMVYDGARICAGCKPAFVQRLQEGAPVTGSALYGGYGSIEKGVSGQYDFSISGVMSEAWSLVSGTKATMAGGMAVMYAVMLGLMMALGVVSAILVPLMIGAGPPENPNALMGIAMVFEVITQIIVMAVSYPFTAALMVIGIRRSAGLPISFSMIFSCFNRAFSLLALNILLFIIVTIGFLLLVIPGIYLFVAYIMAMPLLVEKDMSVWQALETSRKAVSKKWFKIFGLLLMLFLIMMVSMIPLGIGLIWTIPFGFIAVGILYREMFGVEATA